MWSSFEEAPNKVKTTVANSLIWYWLHTNIAPRDNHHLRRSDGSSIINHPSLLGETNRGHAEEYIHYW